MAFCSKNASGIICQSKSLHVKMKCLVSERSWMKLIPTDVSKKVSNAMIIFHPLPYSERVHFRIPVTVLRRDKPGRNAVYQSWKILSQCGSCISDECSLIGETFFTKNFEFVNTEGNFGCECYCFILVERMLLTRLDMCLHNFFISEVSDLFDKSELVLQMAGLWLVMLTQVWFVLRLWPTSDLLSLYLQTYFILPFIFALVIFFPVSFHIFSIFIFIRISVLPIQLFSPNFRVYL